MNNNYTRPVCSSQFRKLFAKNENEEKSQTYNTSCAPLYLNVYIS